MAEFGGAGRGGIGVTKQSRNEAIETTLRQKDESVSHHLETDFREKYAKFNEVLTKNFDLPRSEFVIDSYTCSHYGKIPKQGRLFITPRFVLFYANMLGKKVKKKIPFENIVEIRKEASTLLSASPIEIHMKYKRFTFVSFSHRDQAYHNLLLQWKSNQNGVPYDIKIPLYDDHASPEDAVDEGEEGEHASLSLNQASEPVSGSGAPLGSGKVEIQSMWGSSQSSSAALDGENVPSSVPKRGFTAGTLSRMPKFYESGEGSDKKRSCGCFPCFR